MNPGSTKFAALEPRLNATVVVNNSSTKSLSRQLLDAAGKKGRSLEVKKLIDMIGSCFPSVSSINYTTVKFLET